MKTALRRAGWHIRCANLHILRSVAVLLLTACAGRPDHFYTLNTLPAAASATSSTPTVQVRLHVTVPALVDRAAMVLSTSKNGIAIHEHERWATPLADQVSQTLARDIERRRSDILIGDRGFDQAESAPITVKVDIVRMSAQQNGRATLEAHWRIVDKSVGQDELGSDSFDAPLPADGYAALAIAYSQALSALADRLALGLHRR